MTDPWLILVSAVLLVFVPFDWFVAGVFSGAALKGPGNWILNLAAIRSVAIAIAATIAGGLGVQSIVFVASGGTVRLLPQPIPTLLLAAALIVISLPNVYALWRLAKKDGTE